MSKLYQVYLPIEISDVFSIQIVDETNKIRLHEKYRDIISIESFINNDDFFTQNIDEGLSYYNQYISEKFMFDSKKSHERTEQQSLTLQSVYLSRSIDFYYSDEKIDELLQLIAILHKKKILPDENYRLLHDWNYSKKDFMSRKNEEILDKLNKIFETGRISFSNFIQPNIDRVDTGSWVPNDHSIFGAFIKNIYSGLTDSFHDLYGIDVSETQSVKHVLTKQQKFVANFIQEKSPYRGILLYHGLGSGKTGASISIAEGMRNRRSVIMLPASLRTNFKSDINRFGDVYCRENNLRWVKINLTSMAFNV